VRELAGGGQCIEVAPARLHRFCLGFEQRNGAIRTTRVTADEVTLSTAGPASAELIPTVGGLLPVEFDGLALQPLLAHLAVPRRVGLLLVRASGHSAGVSVAGQVLSSSTDRRQVQGRSAAGGWSQQRFARRRAEQTRAALAQAADTAVRALLGQDLAVLVTGGDRRSVHLVLADPRLAELRPLCSERWLDLGEPRRATLDVAAQRADAVQVLLRS